MTHKLPVRVYYEDTDMGGIVYYANYLKYIERSRSTLVRDLGLDQNKMRDEDGIVFVVVRVEADYLKPARLDDELEVVTEHHAASKTRWVFDQEVQKDGEVLFRAKVTAVCMSTEGRAVRLPAELRAKLG